MKIYKLICLSFISLVLASCFSDKGNYEYESLNPITVRFDKRNYVVAIGESVVITPIITYKDKTRTEAPEVTYEWYFGDELLSTEPVLTYDNTAEIKYDNLFLKVTDVKTGENYTMDFFIMVESKFKTGILILSEDESGMSKLDFIRTYKGRGFENAPGKFNDTLYYDGEYLNVYEELNGNSLGRNPVSVTEHAAKDRSMPDVLTEITVVTENGARVEEINGFTFLKETSLVDEFKDRLLPEKFAPKQILHTCWDSYILDDNGVVYTRRNAVPNAYHTSIFDRDYTFSGEKRYSDIMFSFYPYSQAVLAIEYDAEGKRNYIGISCDTETESMNGKLLNVNAKSYSSHFKDLKGKVVASDYNLDAYDGGQYVLFNDNGKYYLHNFDFHSNNVELIIDYSEIVDLSKVNGGKAVLGLIGCKVKSLVYFYDEDCVYVYDYGSGSSSLLYKSDGRKIVSITENTKIEHFSVTSVDPYIIIAFDNGEVEVHELKRPSLLTIDKMIYKSNNKFGKIKQVLYKKGTTGDFLTSY